VKMRREKARIRLTIRYSFDYAKRADAA